MCALSHDALMYRDTNELVDGTAGFVRAGLDADSPVMVAMPPANAGAVRDELGADAQHVRFEDMTELGANPARIIPFVRDWVEAQRSAPARFVGEPIWPGRSAPEAVEGARHEALLNVAFRSSPVAILCPYDASALDAGVLADCERTHPAIVTDGQHLPSPLYADPFEVYAAPDHPLAVPAGAVEEVVITPDLGSMRAFVRDAADCIGLEDDRIGDLLVAANEAATNTLMHGGSPGVLRVWRDDDALVCEIADHGRITDLLAGRRRPDVHSDQGRGLWLINHLCDLVELRPGPTGTTLRLHMRLDG